MVAGEVPAHVVPVTPATPRAGDIAARKGTRIIMTGNATSVQRGITNTTRVPVIAARQGTRITVMGNATSVQRGITNMTRVPATAARQGTRITMMANVMRNHPVPRPL